MRICSLGICFLLSCITLRATEHGNQAARKESPSTPNKAYLSLCGKEAKPQEVSQALDPKTLAAYDILRNKCANCHNPESESGANTFKNILDREELIRRGIISTKNSQSLLLQQVQSGNMPPGGPHLTSEEITTLNEWIQAGALPFQTVQNDVGFISNDDFETCIVKDLRNIPKEDQKFVRYLTLGNLYNGGRRSELDRTRLALSKLTNSLSWKKKIINPISIDGTGTLFRIDIRDYRWDPAKWEGLYSKNPYKNYNLSTKGKEITEKTDTTIPVVRGDWFTFIASHQPTYYDFLGLEDRDDGPNQISADKKLENLLQVNVTESERNQDMIRAGFKQSNVAIFNRAIERHETPYGSYWKSYDFDNDFGDKNVLNHPLDFKASGGEYIFSLPNGLQGYFIANANGSRLSVAPTGIVIDPHRLDKGGGVVNGLSCMGCHTQGMKRKNDDVLPTYEELEKIMNSDPTQKNPTLIETINNIKKVYKGNEALNAAYSEDEARYRDAIKQTGGSVDTADPVFATSEAHSAPLDVRAMAAELDVKPEEVEVLIHSNLELRQKLSLGADHTVERDDFDDNFSEMLGLLTKKSSLTKDYDPQFEFIKVEVSASPFLMGTPYAESYRSESEDPHYVKLTKPYELQTTEVTQRLWFRLMGYNPSKVKDSDFPVTNVEWYEVNSFISKLNQEKKNEGCVYRLPTEAEWEFAARGGMKTFGSSNFDTASSFADESKVGEFAVFGKLSPTKIRSKLPNPLGLHDMYGNANEWVRDVYTWRLEADQTDPVIIYPSIGYSKDTHVTRGGSFLNSEKAMRSAIRWAQAKATDDTGFRLARTCASK